MTTTNKGEKKRRKALARQITNPRIDAIPMNRNAAGPKAWAAFRDVQIAPMKRMTSA